MSLENARARPRNPLPATPESENTSAQLTTAWLQELHAIDDLPDIKVLECTDSLRTPPAHGDEDTSVFLTTHQAMIAPVNTVHTAHRACGACFARRWQSVRPGALREALEMGTGTKSSRPDTHLNPFAAATIEAALSLAPDAAEHRASRNTSVFDVNLETLAVSHELLISDPECTSCNPLPEDSAADTDVEFAYRPKAAPMQFRQTRLDDYPIEQDAFVNELCGALGPKVASDVTSSTTSATVGCFTVRSGGYLRETFWGGHTDVYRDSETVGILEALEREASMRPRRRRTVVESSLEDLDHPAIDPRDCGVYDEQFYLENPWVEPFSPSTPIRWVWGTSLRDQRPVLVPEIMAYYHVPGLSKRFVQDTSNGCATGASLEEATLHGLFELIERDAFVAAWYGAAGLPEISVSSLGDDAISQAAARLELIGYRPRFFDARSTFDLPVVVGVAERLDGGMGALCYGAGASFDLNQAVAAAMCEIGTDAPNSAGRTEIHAERLTAMTNDFNQVLQLHDHPLMHGLPAMRHHHSFLLDQDRGPQDAASLFEQSRGAPSPGPSISDDVGFLVGDLAKAGFDTVVVNETTPEQERLGLATASVIVPGLLPIDFGWSRQRALLQPRLRTARFDAGLAAEPLGNDDLHRVPHPFP